MLNLRYKCWHKATEEDVKAVSERVRSKYKWALEVFNKEGLKVEVLDATTAWLICDRWFFYPSTYKWRRYGKGVNPAKWYYSRSPLDFIKKIEIGELQE